LNAANEKAVRNDGFFVCGVFFAVRAARLLAYFHGGQELLQTSRVDPPHFTFDPSPHFKIQALLRAGLGHVFQGNTAQTDWR